MLFPTILSQYWLRTTHVRGQSFWNQKRFELVEILAYLIELLCGAMAEMLATLFECP